MKNDFPGAFKLDASGKVFGFTREEWEAGGPPPEKPPLQEFALRVPAVVRQQLEAYVHGASAGAQPGTDFAPAVVLHILEVGIAAYIQSVHHLMASVEQEAGVEEAFTASEQEDILQELAKRGPAASTKLAMDLASRETPEDDEDDPVLENWEALPAKYRKEEVGTSMPIFKWFGHWWGKKPESREDLIDRAEYLIAQVGDGAIQAYRELGARPRSRSSKETRVAGIKQRCDAVKEKAASKT